MLQTDQVTCMVMSEEPDLVGKEVDIVSEEKGWDKERVSGRRRILLVRRAVILTVVITQDVSLLWKSWRSVENIFCFHLLGVKSQV